MSQGELSSAFRYITSTHRPFDSSRISPAGVSTFADPVWEQSVVTLVREFDELMPSVHKRHAEKRDTCTQRIKALQLSLHLLNLEPALHHIDKVASVAHHRSTRNPSKWPAELTLHSLESAFDVILYPGYSGAMM